MKVLGRGNKQAKLALFGEAPGSEELKIGEPFRGPSGRMLDTILGHNGISESEIYIDNILQSSPRGRNPSFEEIKTNLPDLRSRLRELPNLNCLVAIGDIALRALSVFQFQGITKYRGSILPARLINKKMVPIVHPAFIMQHGNKEYRYLHVSISDMARAKEQSIYSEVKRTKRKHSILYNFDEAILALRSLKNLEYWSFDLETSLACLGFGVSSIQSFTIPFASEKFPHIWPEKEKTYLLEELKKTFNKDAKIICQNGFFDKRVLWHDYGIDPLSWQIWIDTMHLHQLLYPELPHSLAFISSIYTEEPYYKDEGYNFKRGQNGEETYFTYNGKDCCTTYESAFEMLEEFREIPGQEDYYWKILQPSFQTLFRMHMNGVYIDPTNLLREVSLLKRVETIERIRLLKSSGQEPNPRAPTEMEPFLLSIGIKEKDLSRTPKTNQIQLTEEVFERLYAKYQLPELDAVLRLRKNLFIQSGFTNIGTDSDGRYRIVFKLGPKSGRLAASGDDKGPQLQNIPAVPAPEKRKVEPNLRSVYAAPPSRVLVAGDLAQADARALAYYIPEPTLISMFESKDSDLFSQICSTLFNIPREEISKHGPHAEKRAITKEIGHGTNYKMGPRRVVQSLRERGIFISERDAKAWQSAYLDRFSGIKVYHLQISDDIRKTRTVYDLLGRRHLLLGFLDDKIIQEACSRSPQGTVAGVMLLGMNSLQAAIDKELWNNEPLILIQIHDEIILECDVSDALRIAELIKKHFAIELTAHERSFTIPMEISIGNNWGELCPLEEWAKANVAGYLNISNIPAKMKLQTSSTSGADSQS